VNSTLDTPKHVAIIMDGNGRWAKARGHARVYGHIRGASRVKPIVEYAGEIGVKALTLYTFSSENWSRPKGEILLLWKLLGRYLTKEVDHLNSQNVKLNVFGDTDLLSADLNNVLNRSVARLSGNTGLNLNLALSYGGRDEILRATRRIAEKVSDKELSVEEISLDLFESELWTGVLGEYSDVDLMIRTSGEKRLSNYLLWQNAYAEFLFEDVYWPDYTVRLFKESIQKYRQRSRRFGDTIARDSNSSLGVDLAQQ